MTPQGNTDKILVIGLDGATFDLVKPWVEQGLLPTLGRFMQTGIHGDLTSVIHPLTAPAWTSFMTGKNPGKHGVFDFILRKEHSYDVRLVDSQIRDQRTLWKILSEQGLQVGVLNIPLNYPPQPVNGWLISWMDAPGTDSVFTYPENLYDELRREVGEYIITVNFHLPTLDKYIEQLHRMIENRAKTTRYLMRAHPWDFLITLFSATDYVQHAFWKFMDRAHPAYTEEGARRYGNTILDIYRKIDGELQTLLEEAGEQATVFIMSDHGAGPLRKVVNLNKWLEMNGYLAHKWSDTSGGKLSRLANEALQKLFMRIKRTLPPSLKGKLRKALPGVRDRVESYLVSSAIDWEKTRAFSWGAYGNIWLNVRGREPQGTVEEGEDYRRLKDEIAEKLLLLQNPDTGERIVEKVHRREELYHGPYVNRAPDLIVQWTDYAYHSRQRFGEKENTLFSDVQTMPLSRLEMNGFHKLNGIFIARGPGIVQNEKLEGARIVDLAPTILYMLGVPIPHDMDGRVLTEIFTPQYTANRTVEYTDQQEIDVPGGGYYSDEEETRIKDRLKGLGYID